MSIPEYFTTALDYSPCCDLSGFSHYKEMSTIWIDVHYYPEREGGNSEIEPLVVKTDLNMKFLIIFRIFFLLCFYFLYLIGGRAEKTK